MDIRPIRTDDDHIAALKEIEALWGAELGTPEGDRLDVLATLVVAYEEKRYPVPPADPIGVLLFSMEQNGRKQKDLAELLGSRSRASEILARKRELTLEQIRKLHREWHIPAGALIGDLEHA